MSLLWMCGCAAASCSSSSSCWSMSSSSGMSLHHDIFSDSLCSLMYRKVEPEQEWRESEPGSSSIGIQTNNERNGSDLEKTGVAIEDAARRRPRQEKCNKYIVIFNIF